MNRPQPRLLTGLEGLRLQGISVDVMLSGAEQDFTDRFYINLAGNAFNAGAYAASVLAALVVSQPP